MIVNIGPIIKDGIILFVFSSSFITSCKAQQVTSVNTCSLSREIYTHYEKISGDSLKVFLTNSNDKCNITLIDSIADNFLRKADFKSYKMLQNLSNYSDGYLSEYLVEKIGKIYKSKFAEFFDYLYSDYKKGRKNTLENFLIESWSSIASLSDTPAVEVDKIESKVIQVVSSTEDSKSKLDYLDSLVKKINPHYLD